jgi:Na+/phosphate symporter
MTIHITELVLIVVGLLMYALASNVKVAEIGRILFAVGLLVFLLHFGGGEIKIGR